MALISFTERGFYCAQADMYIDPWRPVDKAIITHAHADHSRIGMKKYLAHKHSVPAMRLRLGEAINVQGLEYGEELLVNGVKISLHPAGHIIGSAQVRLEYKGEIWVAAGDYKTEIENSCAGFEPVRCHTFITESTFGLPIYKWRPQADIFKDVNEWWAQNNELGKVSLISGYSLGKAQRIIENLDQSIGKIYTHGAVENTNEALRAGGIAVAPTHRVTQEIDKKEFLGHIVVAPPGAMGTSWTKRFGNASTAMCSGWMQLRGARRRRNADRGFVLSDHADWDGLNEAIAATGAEKIYVTHGYQGIYSQWLREQGYDAEEVKTEFEGELAEISGEKEKEEAA